MYKIWRRPIYFQPHLVCLFIVLYLQGLNGREFLTFYSFLCVSTLQIVIPSSSSSWFALDMEQDKMLSLWVVFRFLHSHNLWLATQSWFMVRMNSIIPTFFSESIRLGDYPTSESNLGESSNKLMVVGSSWLDFLVERNQFNCAA